MTIGKKVGGGRLFWIFSVWSFVLLATSFGALEAVALTVGFEDVDAMGEAVEHGAGEAFVAEDLGPVLEGQVGGDDEALAFVGAADDFEEEFGAGLGEGDIA